MPMGRPKAELVLSEDERSQLTSIARSRSITAALVTRARIVGAAAEDIRKFLGERLLDGRSETPRQCTRRA